jgi:hypothetical protein
MAKDNQISNVAILYEKFIDQDFIAKFIQFMILDEEEEEIHFDIHRFRMFKVIHLIRINRMFLCLYH